MNVTCEMVLLMSWVTTCIVVVVAYVKTKGGTFAPLAFIFPFLLTLSYIEAG